MRQKLLSIFNRTGLIVLIIQVCISSSESYVIKRPTAFFEKLDPAKSNSETSISTELSSIRSAHDCLEEKKNSLKTFLCTAELYDGTRSSGEISTKVEIISKIYSRSQVLEMISSSQELKSQYRDEIQTILEREEEFFEIYNFPRYSKEKTSKSQIDLQVLLAAFCCNQKICRTS